LVIVNVIPDVATTLDLNVLSAINVSTTNLDAGRPYDITVTAKDQFGNIATGYDNVHAGYLGTVRITSSDSAATLPNPYTFTTADRGTKTWHVPNGLTLRTAPYGDITVTDINNSALTTTINVNVIPGVLTRFILDVPSSMTAGVSGDITVTAMDAYGNAATAYPGTVHFTSSDDRASLPDDYPFSAVIDYGQKYFRDGLTFYTAGTQTVTVTDTDSGISTTVPVTVYPGPTAGALVPHTPAVLTGGVDGNLWFTELTGNAVVQVTMDQFGARPSTSTTRPLNAIVLFSDDTPAAPQASTIPASQPSPLPVPQVGPGSTEPPRLDASRVDWFFARANGWDLRGVLPIRI
jgi:hypothetical protein